MELDELAIATGFWGIAKGFCSGVSILSVLCELSPPYSAPMYCQRWYYLLWRQINFVEAQKKHWCGTRKASVSGRRGDADDSVICTIL